MTPTWDIRLFSYFASFHVVNMWPTCSQYCILYPHLYCSFLPTISVALVGLVNSASGQAYIWHNVAGQNVNKTPIALKAAIQSFES
jgi:hypothetical protein